MAIVIMTIINLCAVEPTAFVPPREELESSVAATAKKHILKWKSCARWCREVGPWIASLLFLLKRGNRTIFIEQNPIHQTCLPGRRVQELLGASGARAWRVLASNSFTQAQAYLCPVGRSEFLNWPHIWGSARVCCELQPAVHVPYSLFEMEADATQSRSSGRPARSLFARC